MLEIITVTLIVLSILSGIVSNFLKDDAGLGFYIAITITFLTSLGAIVLAFICGVTWAGIVLIICELIGTIKFVSSFALIVLISLICLALKILAILLLLGII